MPRASMALAGAGLCALVAGGTEGRAAGLPEGAGRQLVEGVCTGCHRADQIARSSGYTRAGWQALIGTMIDLSDSPEQQTTIVDYLATHFPPNDRRAPTSVSGEAEIAFKEWVVPTLGQRSRDPIEAADGSIWWAGQWGNLVGRIDPGSGEMTEYPLPDGAMPHSVTLDDAGHVWYTGNKNGTVGMLDPDTGEINVHEMPDPAARDPHTAIFDDRGILWFTLQHSNMVGRLDPASGEIDLVTMPRPNSRPYGIKIDADGTPWVACNGNNCLVEVDPESMEPTEVGTRRRPSGDSTPPRTARSGTSTRHRGALAASTRTAARSRSGPRPAARTPTPTRSP